MPGHLVIVPTTALKDSRLSHAEFKTLCHISTFASTENGWCWFLMSTLAAEMGVSVRAARMHVTELVKLGYIVRKPRFVNGQQRSNEYQVVLNTALKRGEEAQLPGGEEAQIPGGGEAQIPGGGEAQLPTERSLFNGSLSLPLTRADFLREIEKARVEGRLKDITQSESVIATETGEIWDYWAAYPAATPTGDWFAKFRKLLRNSHGVKAEKRQAAKSSARQDGDAPPPAQPTQPWHERLAEKIGEAPARAWIYPLHHDGEQIVCPSALHRERVLRDYRPQIEAEFRRGIPIVVGQTPQEQTSNV